MNVQSLRFRLLAAFVALAILPFLVAGGIFAWQSAELQVIECGVAQTLPAERAMAAIFAAMLLALSMVLLLAWFAVRRIMLPVEALSAAEVAAVRRNRELEQRLRERAAQLEATDRELESFAFSVSHDLRAPLRAIDGFSNIVLEDYGNRLDDEGRRLLKVVRENTQRMDRLINDILSLSRIGRQAMAAATVDLEKMVREVTDELLAAAPGRRVRLEIRALLPAWGDRALLRQVMVNLLANAIKFTGPRPEAAIEVGGMVDGGENHYFVKDNGVGFDMQYAGKLFGVFQRLHGADEFEGTGIGLAIVKRIVTRHGGRVWAEGKVGEGATFHFALPRMEGSE